jgi:hypothetical protein
MTNKTASSCAWSTRHLGSALHSGHCLCRDRIELCTEHRDQAQVAQNATITPFKAHTCDYLGMCGKTLLQVPVFTT